MMELQGLILFAHGARDPRWAAPFESVARRVRLERPQWQVRLAFLELMSPGLAEAGDSLSAVGCSRVDVLPMFLGSGGHLRNDLPPMVEQLRRLHPTVTWTLHPPIGEHEVVLQAMATSALELPEHSAPSDGQTP